MTLDQGLSAFFDFIFLAIIPPLLHTHLSPPYDVCDIPDQGTHCHTLGPKLRASSVTWYLARLRVKVAFCIIHCNYGLPDDGGTDSLQIVGN
jgi:hypothetical protein